MNNSLTYDVKTKQTVIQEIEFGERVKTNEELEQEYRRKVLELIGAQYSPSDEIGLTNDALLQVMVGEPVAQTYTDYRVYVEGCKDAAHMEVYGEERT